MTFFLSYYSASNWGDTIVIFIEVAYRITLINFNIKYGHLEHTLFNSLSNKDAV